MAFIHFLEFSYKTKYFIYFTGRDKLINPREKYYIASNLYNNELILPGWIYQMKKLIKYLGKDNVYLSIYENGDSTDNTVTYLNEFKA